VVSAVPLATAAACHWCRRRYDRLKLVCSGRQVRICSICGSTQISDRCQCHGIH
jgi:hypothetical protein